MNAEIQSLSALVNKKFLEWAVEQHSNQGYLHNWKGNRPADFLAFAI